MLRTFIDGDFLVVGWHDPSCPTGDLESGQCGREREKLDPGNSARTRWRYFGG